MKELFHLEAARSALDNAKRECVRAEIALAKKRSAFCEALPATEEQPCVAAVLPSGLIAVHVWVEGSRNPNQLHFIRPGYFNEDASPRCKFKGEQLGKGDGA